MLNLFVQSTRRVPLWEDARHRFWRRHRFRRRRQTHRTCHRLPRPTERQIVRTIRQIRRTLTCPANRQG